MRELLDVYHRMTAGEAAEAIVGLAVLLGVTCVMLGLGEGL